MADLVRFKASRPVYRRGGLVLGSAAWVEVVDTELAKEALIALLTDPVVTVEGETGEGWYRLSIQDRQDFAEHLAFVPAAPPPSPPPPPPPPPPPSPPSPPPSASKVKAKAGGKPAAKPAADKTPPADKPA